MTILGEKLKSEMVERIEQVGTELAKAPEWKKGTPWWTDREREIEACQRRLEMLK